MWVLAIYTALSLSAATAAAALKPHPALGATEQETKQPEPKAEPAAEKEPSGTTPQDREAVSAEDVEPEARDGVSLLPGIAYGPEDKDTKDRKRVEPTAVRLQRPSDIDDRQKSVRENRPAWDNVPAYIRSARPSSDETLPNVRAERPSIYGNPPFAEPYTPPGASPSPETEIEESAPAETSGRTKSKLPRKKKITKPTPPLSGVRTRLKRPRDSEAVKEEQAKSSKRPKPERKGEAGRGEPSSAEQEKMPYSASETPHTSPGEQPEEKNRKDKETRPASPPRTAPGERAGPEDNQEAEPGMTSDSGIRT